MLKLMGPKCWELLRPLRYTLSFKLPCVAFHNMDCLAASSPGIKKQWPPPCSGHGLIRLLRVAAAKVVLTTRLEIISSSNGPCPTQGLW